MNAFTEKWEAQLQELARKNGVPGASLAVLHGEEQLEIVTGITNLNTNIPVTADTGFLTASVSKIFTATAIMRLVHKGSLTLDVPIKKYLPEMKLADKTAEKTITLRHLLTHTSGIMGDNFVDYGRGDDFLKKFVAAYADIPQMFPPGKFHSYCNAGFNFIARIAELVTGGTWESTLRTELLEPLKIADEAVTLPEEAILRRIAVGHIAGDDGPTPVQKWEIRRSQVPSGGVIASARSLLALARVHIQGGQAPDGSKFISKKLIDEMQKPFAKEPSQDDAFPARGLAWSIEEVAGKRMLSHGGNTNANTANFSVIPSEGFAFVLLTNAGTGTALVAPMFQTVVSDALGVNPGPAHEEQIPPLPPQPPSLDLDKYVGEWDQINALVAVERADDGLTLSLTTKGDMEGLAMNLPPVPLRPVNAELFLAVIPMGAEPIHLPIRFLGFDRSGKPEFIHLAARVVRRTK